MHSPNKWPPYRFFAHLSARVCLLTCVANKLQKHRPGCHVKSVDHSKVKLSTEGNNVLLGTWLPFLALRNTRYCMWLSGPCGRAPHINYGTINVIKVNKSRFCPSFVFIVVYCSQYGGTHPAILLLTTRGQKITLNGPNSRQNQFLFYLFLFFVYKLSNGFDLTFDINRSNLHGISY